MRRGKDGGLFIDAARVDWAAVRDDIADSYRMGRSEAVAREAGTVARAAA